MTALLSIAAALLQLPVTPPRFPVARLEISPAAAAVEVGQQVRLTARALDAAGQPVPHAQIEWLDRKSTRLNSSHSQISYAVFCLKKKKKPRPQRAPAHKQHAHGGRRPS